MRIKRNLSDDEKAGAIGVVNDGHVARSIDI